MKQSERVIKSARRLRQNMTESEWELWNMLRGPQCHVRFRRQHPIGSYIVDFYCRDLKLVIEADGGQHGPERDGIRDQFLKDQGYRVIRFWNNDILNNPSGVWDVIVAEIVRLSQLPRAGSVRVVS